MSTDRARWAILAALPLLGGCAYDNAVYGHPVAKFGEPNRQTMMAQVVDPEPEYDTLIPPTSAEHAGQATERYRNDKVKKPDRPKSTVGGGS